ncbi:hypothetical protein [Tunicatimonas pelagia]|uniref:hypothetical protein n=1 Tax=Tunicatimonas pelagia TaxID=931531 RepID=UPI002666B548|nr:hypothetical protein [Tunicatimonas pelagia]WKN45296.1 hypothetical protein P0M28_10030 [Tunicatimonas pelagia]
MEVLFEIFVTYLLSYPGAFIRWIMSGGKKSFSQIKEDTFWNSVVAIIAFSAIVLLIAYGSRMWSSE